MSGIKELTIDNTTYEAKGNFKFSRKAKSFSKRREHDGTEVEDGGITSILTSLLSRKTEALADFWECAVYASKPKNVKTPTREEIEDVLMELIDEGKTKELFIGAVDVLNNSGFFKEESGMFWYNVNQAPKLSDNKEKGEFQRDQMIQMYVTLMGEKPYNTANL